MMPGMIMLWSGAIGNVPFSWHLCDGTMGTPDLRNKFIVAAGDTYDPNDEGGAETHDHTFTTDGHKHTIPGGADVETGAAWKAETDIVQDTGTVDANSHLPPYYALAYIMKL